MRVEDIPGYSLEEASVLLIKGVTNVAIRGLDFLGPGKVRALKTAQPTYVIPFALAMNGHVNGCRFGVAPDAATTRNQFNIIVDEYILIILESGSFRISGNFIQKAKNVVKRCSIPFSKPIFPVFLTASKTASSGVSTEERRSNFGVSDD